MVVERVRRLIERLLRALMPDLIQKIVSFERRIRRLEKSTPRLIERAGRFVACEMIEGDYLEFGVYKGDSFTEAFHAIAQAFAARISQLEGDATPEQQRIRAALWQKMRFFAFDSFEGLPDLVDSDTRTRDFRKGQYAFSQESFERNLRSAGVDMSRVVSIPGWFSETCNAQTWERHDIRKAAIVWVDGDLYASAKAVLSQISSLIQDGTVLIFDDWYAFRGNPELGEQKAFNEWLDELHEFRAVPFFEEGTWRKGFIMSQRINV